MLLGTTWTVRNIVRLTYWKTKHQRTPIINLFHSDFCFIHFFYYQFFWCKFLSFSRDNEIIIPAFISFKDGLSPCKKNLHYLLHWKPFKNDGKCFSFHSKAIFVLKIFKFLSWLFGHVRKTAWLERLTAKFMTSQTG